MPDQSSTALAARFNAVVEVLAGYFDGLHHSDTQRLRQVFHVAALYASATEGTLRHLAMAEYFPVVAARPSPASLGQSRADRVLRIEFAGPVTALAVVECRIAPKRFTDLLTLVFVDGRWQIISKVFHFELDG